jgi:hypothetical protein
MNQWLSEFLFLLLKQRQRDLFLEDERNQKQKVLHLLLLPF